MPFGARRPSGRRRKLNVILLKAGLLSLTLAMLTGCGNMPFGKNRTASAPAAQQQTTEIDPRTLARPASAEEGFSLDALPPLHNPGTELFDPLGQITPLEARPGGSLGVLGFNLDSYFSEDLKDPMARIERVERAVSAMNRDLKTIAAPIQRLVAVEGDIQELVKQLETLLSNEPAPTAARSAAAYYPPPAEQPRATTGPPAALAAQPQYAQAPPVNQMAKTIPPPMTGGTVQVMQMRLGEHPDKTRIVMDVNGPAAFRHDLDNSENLLVIELPTSGWAAAREMRNLKSPLISSYSVQPLGDKGSRVIVQLKQAASVVYEGTLAPNRNSKNHRLILDLKSGAVHK